MTDDFKPLEPGSGERLRDRRKRLVRPRLEKLRHLSVRRLVVLYEDGAKLDADGQVYDPRPKTRGECIDGANKERPCPYVSCKYHLYLDVVENGNIKANFPDIGPEDLETSCVLDAVDDGHVTLNRAGDLLNLTRERTRQIEDDGSRTMYRELRKRGFKKSDLEKWSMPTSLGEQLEGEAMATGGVVESDEPEEPTDEDDLEVVRWANEVYAEMRYLGLRKALALANRPTDALGEEEKPL